MLTRLNPTFALPYARERRATLRRTRLLVGRERQAPQPIRRWAGRQLVRAGAWLADDPTMRPVRVR